MAEAPEHRGAVEGEIQFPPDASPFAGATVRVSLLDVTRADAAARPVAEQTLTGVSFPSADARPVAFTLRAPSVDPRARYVVRVHVDVNGDGRVSRGDYTSTQSHPVLTFEHGNRVVVRVRAVAS